jgi:hypothetical protein
MGYSETQRTTTVKDTTGEAGFKANGGRILSTTLTVAGTARVGHGRRLLPAARNAEHPPVSCVAIDTRCRGTLAPLWKLEAIMVTRRHDQIIETPTEARQAESGPSVLALLTVSTGLAMLILGVVWFVFFRT